MKQTLPTTDVTALSPFLGAELRGISLADLDDATFSVVQQALLDHLVIFFRDQHLAPRDQLALAKRFGEAALHPAYPVLEGAVTVLEHTEDKPTKIDTWHTDMTFQPRPPMGTVLQAVVVPSCGGDTMWSSMYAAYDALSDPIKKLVDGLNAVHDFAHGFKESLAEPGGRQRLQPAVQANPPVTHPAVRTHPVTGRRALFVNRLFTTGFVELNRGESDALLAMLCDHCETPEFSVRFAWQPGSVAIWDNRCTQHRPVNDYIGHRRLHRVTIQGDSPF